MNFASYTVMLYGIRVAVLANIERLSRVKFLFALFSKSISEFENRFSLNINCSFSESCLYFFDNCYFACCNPLSARAMPTPSAANRQIFDSSV